MGSEPFLSLAQVQSSLEAWRDVEIELAADFVPRPCPRETPLARAISTVAHQIGATLLPPGEVEFGSPDQAVRTDALVWARGYYESDPTRSRTPDTTPLTVLKIARLQAAADTADGWIAVPSFDDDMDAAIRAGRGEGAAPAQVPAGVRELARRSYAAAALRVERHRELQRSRAAAILVAFDAARSSADAMVVRASAGAYAPQADDKTIAELLAAARVEKVQEQLAKGYTSERAEAYVAKNYGAVFLALGEMLGEAEPARAALTREALKRVRSLIFRLPANGAKIYPGAKLTEMADRAAADGRMLMAPLTQRNYLVHLAALCRLAVREGWLDTNPAEKLVPPRRARVKRRGLEPAELTSVFDSLVFERGSERWWVLAILTFSGARAGEICQLQIGDVKVSNGQPYLDLSRFDETGIALGDKELKSASSERFVPLHPSLVAAGFTQFVAAAKGAGQMRLFPSFRQQKAGDYTKDFSKWFGRFLDGIGLTDRALCLHSLRHGFRDAGRRVGLSDGVIDALGGWAAQGVGQRYGNRHAISVNAPLMAKIEFGDFTLGNLIQNERLAA